MTMKSIRIGRCGFRVKVVEIFEGVAYGTCTETSLHQFRARPDGLHEVIGDILGSSRFVCCAVTDLPFLIMWDGSFKG